MEYAHAALKARNRETKVTIFTSASGRLDFGFYRETFSRYKNSALLSLVAYVHQIAERSSAIILFKTVFYNFCN